MISRGGGVRRASVSLSASGAVMRDDISRLSAAAATFEARIRRRCLSARPGSPADRPGNPAPGRPGNPARHEPGEPSPGRWGPPLGVG
eukprot:1475594-Pyramimonas_sp.AAC.1